MGKLLYTTSVKSRRREGAGQCIRRILGIKLHMHLDLGLGFGTGLGLDNKFEHTPIICT